MTVVIYRGMIKELPVFFKIFFYITGILKWTGQNFSDKAVFYKKLMEIFLQKLLSIASLKITDLEFFIKK